MIDYTKATKMDKSWSVHDQIGFLRYCAKKYEADGSSPISDKDYDLFYYELQELVPDDSFFDEVGGNVDTIQGQSVQHDTIMGSLSKSLDIPLFDKWLHSQYPVIDKETFILQHKVDGLSLGIRYQNGKLVQSVTRGDGNIGIDVTEKAKVVKGVALTIAHKGKIEVRGECFKNRQDFYKKWHTSVGGEYKNPRNFTAGAINEKDPKETARKEVEFVAYEVVGMDFDTEVEKNKFLSEQGFATLNATTKRTKEGSDHSKIVKAAQYFMDSIDRANLPYDIDGVVFKLNDIKAAKKLGSVSGGRKPKANRAIKFPAEEKETEYLSYEIQVGRTGKMIPVANLKPVELGGAMIKKATLCNFGAMIGPDAIKIGSIVVVAKKGDIIPQIIKVKKQGSKMPDIPTECPSCKSKLVWTDSKVDLMCENEDCVAQLNKKIEFWFTEIGVKGFGKGTIARLTDPDFMEWEGKPIINSLSEMYYMLDNDRKAEHPFRKYAYIKSQIGEVTYNNLIASIKSVTEVTLPMFIRALGISHIGSSAKDITDIAPTIDDLEKLTVAALLKISGFGTSKANNFINAWKSRKDEINRLLKYVTIKQVKQASDKLNGKKFCFTGSFSKPRDEYQKMVLENGGKASNSVGKDVILVWDGDMQGSKLEKAQKEGNQIISEAEFLKIVG